MTERLQRNVRDDGGFSMIEMLIVLVIMMILTTIAAPAYLKFRVRANKSAAQTNIHNAVAPLIEWNGEHTDGYKSVTVTKLKVSYNISLKNVSLFNQSSLTYCLKSKVGTEVWYKGGPYGSLTSVVPHPPC